MIRRIVFAMLGAWVLGASVGIVSCTGSNRTNAAAEAEAPARLGGDRDEHGCLASAGYVWSEVLQDCIRVFECGVRTESVDGSDGAAYLVFAADSSRVELFFSNGNPGEILDRRVLPSGASVWNVEDDDTKNVRRIDSRWIVECRGRVLYRESSLVADEALGRMQERVYDGEWPGRDGVAVNCALTVRNREHSGDGTFMLEYHSGLPGEEEVVPTAYSGRRFTLRGSAGDPDAVVWQLVADEGPRFLFCLSDNGHRLVMLNEMERPQEECVLQLVESRWLSAANGYEEEKD